MIRFCFCLHFKQCPTFLEILFVVLHYPALDIESQTTSLRCWWMTWCFTRLSISALVKSLQEPPHFQPQVFHNLFLIPSSLPSPSFILGDISCSCLDFTVWKPNTRTERGTTKQCENGIVQQERLTSKLTTGCEGVTLASALTLSLFYCRFSYCSVHPLWRRSWTSVYTVVCWNEEERSAQTSELAENCQKSPCHVISHNKYIQNQKIKLSCLFFHDHVIV